MAIIDIKNTTIRMYDGTVPNPNFIEIKIGEGTVSYNERREIHFVKSRGDLDAVRVGDDIEMDVAFQFQWDFITSSDPSPATVEDALKQRNVADSWLSATPVDQDPDAPYSVNIAILYTAPCTEEETEDIVFPQFHYTSLAHSLKDGTVDCQGQCNSTEALITRSSDED